MEPSFFDVHEYAWLTLIGLSIFPRITMFIMGDFFSWGLMATGWHVAGWIFAPHLLVAILATSRYWDTDPLLCFAAWVFAFTGTFNEGSTVARGHRD